MLGNYLQQMTSADNIFRGALRVNPERNNKFGWSNVYKKGAQVVISISYPISHLQLLILILANSTDPDEMPHDVAFHLGLHILSISLFVIRYIAHLFCRLLVFFKINFFEKLFREYHQSVKQFGFRSGPTYCWG